MVIDVSEFCLCCDSFVGITHSEKNRLWSIDEQIEFLIGIGEKITEHNDYKEKHSERGDRPPFKLLVKAGHNKHLFEEEKFKERIAKLDMEIVGEKSLPDTISIQ